MIDLNVLLDVVQRREPHFGASAEVLAMAARGEMTALVPSHCLTTLYYIIARHADRARADSTMDWVLGKLRVQAEDHTHFLRARGMEIVDFEDAVVAALAESAKCRFIISRNVSDFEHSPVRALTPEEFLAGPHVPDG
jgi:predicted nucleic acid-binding protein